MEATFTFFASYGERTGETHFKSKNEKGISKF